MVLEAAGLKVQLVNARAVKNVPGRAKTDKKDAVWLAKLTERGMLQPSFVPPYDIRRLREYTRLRADLVHDRARHWQRLEKLLERALIKVSSVASTLDTQSVRAMLEALIAGQRNPKVLADLAIGKMRAKREGARRGAGREVRGPPRRARPHAAGPDRRPDHADRPADRPRQRADRRRSPPPRASTPTAPPARTPAADPDAAVLPGRGPAGRDHRLRDHRRPGHHRRDRPGHDASSAPPGDWCPGRNAARRPASPARRPPPAPPGKGNPWLNGPLGEIAASASRTDTFLGERYRRLAKRRGKRKALAAIARSILVIIFHLLADPAARFHDLGSGYYDERISASARSATTSASLRPSA